MLQRMHGAAQAWRVLFGALGVCAIAYQLWAAIVGNMTTSPLGSTVVYFSFFTTQTNVLGVLAFLAPALLPDSRLGRWASSEGVRAAATMYLVVVGLVFHFILSATWKPTAAAALGNLVVHYIMPVAILLDWLLFVPKGRLRWIDAPKWLAFPLVYGIWTIIHGHLIDWYPYFFIDIGELGWSRALANYALLLGFFLVVGLIVVALDRALSALGKGDRSLTPS